MADPRLERLTRSARANLKRRFARRPLAVVLSGGGSQGSFEIGVLRYLYDGLGLRPSILCGVSVGAIIAAKLAEGDDPSSGRRALDEAEAIWRGLRTNADMWLTEPWFDTLRSHVSWAHELRGRAAEHGAVGSQARVALRMLGELVRHPPQTDGTVDALRQALHAQSLLSMAPVHRLVEEHLDPALIAASGTKLRIGTVSLESGELRFVSETGELRNRRDEPLGGRRVSLREAVLASAAIPMIFPPVRLLDEHYVDGGARQILPLDLAFRYLGAGHIFAVVASAQGVDAAPDFAERGLLDIARRVTAEITPDETLRKELDPPRGWGRRVTLLSPELDVHDALTVDPALLAASIDYGYMRAADILLGLSPEQADLSAEIARARVRLRLASGPVVGFFEERVPPPGDPAEAVRTAAREEARIEALVARRRELAGPLPPGDCAPVAPVPIRREDAPGV